MKVKLIYIGKTGKSFLEAGEKEYLKRVQRYIPIEIIEIPDLKNASKRSVEEIKNLEGEAILKKIKAGEHIILLDENGKEMNTMNFSKFVQQQFNSGKQGLNFVIGGPYGFSQKVYERADAKLSLSKMTFSHQMIRMFFLEQLYRALTILKGEPYHHEG